MLLKYRISIKETIELMERGGLVISSDHSPYDGNPIKNIWTEINAAKKYVKY